MNLPVFYRGLLCALAERRPAFVAEGASYHKGFREMLEEAVARHLYAPAADLLENFDPAFGVSPEAATMVIQGELDFLLALTSHRPCMALFMIDAKMATTELGHLPDADVFRELAAVFDRKLPKAAFR